VADTISNVVHPGTLTNAGIFADLVGAILWDILTWILGLPTSSSHALVGGLAGAAVATAGWRTLVASEYQKIFVFIVLSPIVGILLAFTFMTGVFWLFHRYRKVEKLNRGFRRGQLVSAAAFSLGHGGNDAQKTMGVILALLIANGLLAKGSDVPLWVVLSAHAAIALGTLLGGWRIVHTMGSKITKPSPSGACVRSPRPQPRSGGSRSRGSRSPRRIRSRERSSASARRNVSRRSAGGSQAGWYGHGSSRSPARS